MKVTIESKNWNTIVFPIKENAGWGLSVNLSGQSANPILRYPFDAAFKDLQKLHLGFFPVNDGKKQVNIDVWGSLIKKLQRELCFGDDNQLLRMKLTFMFRQNPGITPEIYNLSNVELLPTPNLLADGNFDWMDEGEVSRYENSSYRCMNTVVGRVPENGAQQCRFKIKLDIDMTDYCAHIMIMDLEIPCELKNKCRLDYKLFGDFQLISEEEKSYWCHRAFFYEHSEVLRDFFDGKKSVLLNNNWVPLLAFKSYTIAGFKKLWKSLSGNEARPDYARLRLDEYSNLGVIALRDFVYFGSVAFAQEFKDIAEELLKFAETYKMMSLETAMKKVMSERGHWSCPMDLCILSEPDIDFVMTFNEVSRKTTGYLLDFRGRSCNDHPIERLSSMLQNSFYGNRSVEISFRTCTRNGQPTIEYKISGEILGILNCVYRQYVNAGLSKNQFVAVSLKAALKYGEIREGGWSTRTLTISQEFMEPDRDKNGIVDFSCYVGSGNILEDLCGKDPVTYNGYMEVTVDVSWHPELSNETLGCNITNKSIWEAKRYTDFKLVSKDKKEFPCHKDVILASCNKELVVADLLVSIRDNFEFHKCEYSSGVIETALKFVYYNDLRLDSPTPNFMTELLQLSRDYGFESLWRGLCRIIQAQRVNWFDGHNAVKLFHIVSKNEDRPGVKALKQKLLLALQHYSSELDRDELCQSLFPSKMGQDLFKTALKQVKHDN